MPSEKKSKYTEKQLARQSSFIDYVFYGLLGTFLILCILLGEWRGQ